MKSLEDLFEHQLKDLYSAETQLLDALPKVLDNVSDGELKKAISSHMEETKEQREKVAEVCEDLGIEPKGETCKAMKGLIEETEHFLEEDAEADVRDAGIIANCQRVEHYEIAGYGTAVRYARELGHDQAAKKLQGILDQEYNADQKLDNIAQGRLNRKAID